MCLVGEDFILARPRIRNNGNHAPNHPHADIDNRRNLDHMFYADTKNVHNGDTLAGGRRPLYP